MCRQSQSLAASSDVTACATPTLHLPTPLTHCHLVHPCVTLLHGQPVTSFTFISLLYPIYHALHCSHSLSTRSPLVSDSPTSAVLCSSLLYRCCLLLPSLFLSSSSSSCATIEVPQQLTSPLLPLTPSDYNRQHFNERQQRDRPTPTMSGKLDVSRINKSSAAADKAMPDKTITVSNTNNSHLLPLTRPLRVQLQQ